MLSHAALLLLFTSVSQEFNLPDGLLEAICFVESSHNTRVVNKSDGGSPSIGVCQIKYTTARQMGYRGYPNTLFKPISNIYYAGKYLRHQINRYGEMLPAIAAYNSGTYFVDKNGRAFNYKYVGRVLQVWRKNEDSKKKALSKVPEFVRR